MASVRNRSENTVNLRGERTFVLCHCRRSSCFGESVFRRKQKLGHFHWMEDAQIRNFRALVPHTGCAPSITGCSHLADEVAIAGKKVCWERSVLRPRSNWDVSSEWHIHRCVKNLGTGHARGGAISLSQVQLSRPLVLVFYTPEITIEAWNIAVND